MTCTTKWVASRQAIRAEGQALSGTVNLQCLNRVLRAGGRKSAANSEAHEQGSQEETVGLNESDAEVSENPHEALLYTAFSPSWLAFVGR